METGLSLASIVAIALASFVIVIVPGPTVTVIIANSLRDGARAGLLNVAGTQAGLVPMVLIVALGLKTVVALMAQWFFWIKLTGAAYLIWLGYKLWRSDGSIGDPSHRCSGRLWAISGKASLVIWSNPKALLFFGAFLPQFIDPAGNAFLQMVYGGVSSWCWRSSSIPPTRCWQVAPAAC